MTYPTAPPWAVPPATPAPEEPQPWTPPGRLLVAYPEEMDPTSRPEAPSWLPVVFWTLAGALPGVISAARRSREARRGRHAAHPYWIAWSATLLTMAALALALI
ncbi:hypothetical protein Ade02nite_43060 [Paractinoplanes deccanensis]|uniref:DUF4190 domain-containing protein n=1 Tax=Paractinoplanes deccanensis TaxID=113561 RepID=A0ABQ3Y6R3_9ACTN|nr:hypothetical protein [Actinoplanes deccanensis]GID75665.1 hypothetical protein Ade02nite_43060 [Actinoplanes deccanensis]